jgi:S-adenosylmethionine hydrolase
LTKKKNFRVFELTNEKFFAEKISRTFHGRDIFAPVAAHLSKGVEPNEFGAEIKDFVHFANPPRKNFRKKIEAEIIHIDRFGNFITNLKKRFAGKVFLEIGEKKIINCKTFLPKPKRRSVYDFRQRGLFGNRGVSRFGGGNF